MLIPLGDKLVKAVLQNIYECRLSGKSGDKQNEVSTSFVLIGRYNSKDPCKVSYLLYLLVVNFRYL